jgi:hypothetical protein
MMKSLRQTFNLLAAAGALSLASFEGVLKKQDNYAQPAHHPSNPGNVVVKVSLEKQMVYVMEGNRPLLVTATCVGMPGHPTPKGSFTVYSKIKEKRSGTYGFAVNNSTGDARPAERSWVKGGEHYVGHPMPFWVEFAPGYGFHMEYVWPVPRSHGCLRLHRNDAPKFWELTRIGTPVLIRDSWPEDETIGKNVPHPGPEHYNAPEPPPGVFVSDKFFSNLPAAQFVD